jgi:phosphoribosylamine---glycine ligase
VIGNGAREHCLTWKISRSQKVSQLFAAPGNAGTAQLATNLDIKVSDFAGLNSAVEKNRIELIVVGPESPLAEGVVDYFQKLGIPIFGPDRAAAQLEASKAFAKSLFQKYNIPCARSQTFTDAAEARAYVRKVGPPLVVKADGLAAGKGVIMAETGDSALEAIADILENKNFGTAGDKVIIEEKLTGREMSYFAVCDGQNVLPLMPACDYKRAEDGDRGLNTGGMGSYSPPFFFTPELENTILSTIIRPTVAAMRKEGAPFRGVLFAGLMVKDGDPKLLEYNVRLGDPECQVILPRLKGDILDIILGVVKGDLRGVKAEWSQEACVGVAMASGGYPGHYETGFPISGLDKLPQNVMVFQAGTRVGNERGQVLTNGGRVLTVAALGRDIPEARDRVYAEIGKISFSGCHFRKDIARF